MNQEPSPAVSRIDGGKTAPAHAPLRVLTLAEAALLMRCSLAHLRRIRSGRCRNLPPLPAFHCGRRVLIRYAALEAWIGSLETIEREAIYATGFCGLRNDELEFIAGA